MAENKIRQAENRIFIEGLLSEVNIEEKDIKGKPAITGNVVIKTSATEEHEVNVFSYKYKKDGTENGIYKGLVTVMNEYKSMAEVGKEEADRVRITTGQLGLNEYFGQDGQLKSYPKISSSFINRLKPSEELNPKAEFEVEIFVQSVVPEIKNDEETGRVIIKAYIVEYGGKIFPFSFIVENEEAIPFVEANYESGKTVWIAGDIINKVEKKVVKKETAFGKDKEREVTNTTREYVVTGGDMPFDEENAKAYNIDEIKKALAERELSLEELKNKKSEGSSAPRKESTGFSTKKDEETPKSDQKGKYDIPF